VPAPAGKFHNYTVVQLSAVRTTAVPHPLPEALTEHIAERFRALAETTRLRLLDELRDGPMTVGELAAALGTTQQNVSKHLGVLVKAGLVDREKEGNRVRCFMADDSVFELCELVCGRLRRHVSDLDRLLRNG
jgi:DNA-binding transcriptional ArsR family regulator